MTATRTHLPLVLGLAAVLAFTAASAAEAPGKRKDVAKNVALNICARGHDISPNAKASDPHPPGVAPAFVAVAADPTIDRDRLLKFLRFPHGAMDNVFLTRKENEDLADYILSLRATATK